MEPSGEARCWISEFLGVPVDDHLSRATEAWASLELALAAIRNIAIAPETQPAVQVHIPAPSHNEPGASPHRASD